MTTENRTSHGSHLTLALAREKIIDTVEKASDKFVVPVIIDYVAVDDSSHPALVIYYQHK